jgi:hypothetical protein
MGTKNSFKRQTEIDVSTKLDFARAANDFSDDLPKGRGDCFDYGSWYGCDIECPTFLKGECEIEDKDAFRNMVLETGDDGLIAEFFGLYPQLKEAGDEQQHRINV